MGTAEIGFWGLFLLASCGSNQAVGDGDPVDSAGSAGTVGLSSGVGGAIERAPANDMGGAGSMAMTEQGDASGIGGAAPPAGGHAGTGGAKSSGSGGSMGALSVDGGSSCAAGRPGPGAHPDLKPGVWTKLGPPGVADAAYGVIGVTIDPCDTSTLYATVQDTGIWKTTDGGSNWARLGAPGQDADVWDDETNFLDVPFEVAVDPSNSKHLYATDGVRGGPDMGFWISNDAGANWSRPKAFADISKSTTAVDTTDMAIDPTDFRHILLASHSPWRNLPAAGVMESKDGGQSWIAHPPVATWPAGTAGIEFLYDPVSGVGDANTWLNMTAGDGFWRTTDAGAHWAKVSTEGGIHGLTVLYRASDGVLYAGGSPYPQRSTDNGLTWAPISNGLPSAYYYVVSGDGKNLYTMKSLNFGGMPYPHYSTSLDGIHWSDFLPAETFSDGPIVMKFDAINRILYSANWKAGILALKLDP